MERLNTELKAAMLAGETTRRDTIRLLISSLRNYHIDHKDEVNDDSDLKVVAKEVKQRRDSITEYEKANRKDLADREKAELEILLGYMPAQMSPAEIRALVISSITRTGAKGLSDLGRVMKDAVPAALGRADGSTINAVAREILMSSAG
jgi:uncharacterized protein YqeY